MVMYTHAGLAREGKHTKLGGTLNVRHNLLASSNLSRGPFHVFAAID